MPIIDFLKKIQKSDILVSDKVRRKIEGKEQGLTVDEVLNKIFDFRSLRFEAKQNGSYELLYDYSGKYHLVVILFVNTKARLASAWKSSKSVDKLLKKATYIYDHRRKISLGKNQ